MFLSHIDLSLPPSPLCLPLKAMKTCPWVRIKIKREIAGGIELANQLA